MHKSQLKYKLPYIFPISKQLVEETSMNVWNKAVTLTCDKMEVNLNIACKTFLTEDIYGVITSQVLDKG
jgi:predicted transcriptional regulator